MLGGVEVSLGDLDLCHLLDGFADPLRVVESEDGLEDHVGVAGFSKLGEALAFQEEGLLVLWFLDQQFADIDIGIVVSL